MGEYTVKGPFRIEVKKLSGGKEVVVDNFWSNRHTRGLKEEKGVYVYAIKSSKTKIFTPFYVGQAKKTFEQEVFQPRNLLKYGHAVRIYMRGYPAMFFVVYPVKRGKVNEKEVTEIESHLIKLGVTVNPNIENDRGIKGFAWSINGVINSTKKQTSSEKQFGGMFGLKKEH